MWGCVAFLPCMSHEWMNSSPTSSDRGPSASRSVLFCSTKGVFLWLFTDHFCQTAQQHVNHFDCNFLRWQAGNLLAIFWRFRLAFVPAKLAPMYHSKQQDLHDNAANLCSFLILEASNNSNIYTFLTSAWQQTISLTENRGKQLCLKLKKLPPASLNN